MPETPESQKRRNDPETVRSCHVSLVALPDAAVSTLAGIYDVINGVALMGIAPSRFRVEVVGEATGPLMLASGVPFHVQRSIDEVKASDIVIVPSVLLGPGGWAKGRYPRLEAWIHRIDALPRA